MHWEIILSILAVIVLSYGLLYTARIARRQKYQGEYDTEINEKVQAHPYIRNPVFLAYLVGLGLALAYIVYLAINGNY